MFAIYFYTRNALRPIKQILIVFLKALIFPTYLTERRYKHWNEGWETRVTRSRKMDFLGYTRANLANAGNYGTTSKNEKQQHGSAFRRVRNYSKTCVKRRPKYRQEKDLN